MYTYKGMRSSSEERRPFKEVNKNFDHKVTPLRVVTDEGSLSFFLYLHSYKNNLHYHMENMFFPYVVKVTKLSTVPFLHQILLPSVLESKSKR